MAKRRPVVVIDAGHGGHDPGAIGLAGVIEKNVSLDVALMLRELLVRGDRQDVVLTRDSDVFVPLIDRVRLAQRSQAHLLVSIHADALSDPKTRGASVYALSPKASDEHVAELADRENSAAAIGNRPFAEHPPEVSVILESLMFREKQTFSFEMQRAVVDAFGQDVPLLHNPARHGHFLVLRSGSVPSILVEMGFLSNREDEQLLISKDYRFRIASALRDAIDLCGARFAEAAD